ncbi:MAG: sugar ABC transporter ATP-binding protein [Thiotrichales bacterium]|nr:sugar ABC transporter ATP-binding protein [Thiotrichales bacterium]MCY4349186.1 sugar ABC transporter ATP-binding protein [Thiotrichales bacterium]
MHTEHAAALALVGVSRQFPGTLALDGVDFFVRSGEIHALVGENGAGKSTLVGIMGGSLAADAGHMEMDGIRRRFASPRDAWAAGVHVIHQELMLFPRLSVAENIFLGVETGMGVVRRRRWDDEAARLLESLDHRLDPRCPAGALSVADQQMVEIARALASRARVLILDEPSAVIAGDEVAALMGRLREMRETGVAIVYISHRLEEVFALSDRVTVLKDGRRVATRPTEELTRDSLTTMMIGRAVEDIFPPRRSPPVQAPPLLDVRNLSSPPRVLDGCLDLRPGEILGLGGLAGAGRSELAEAIFGAVPVRGGTVRFAGEDVTGAPPREMIRRGMGFLTEDRKSQGLLMLLDIAANISAPALDEFHRAGLFARSRELSVAEKEIARLSIAAPSAESPVAALSGGNQQKTLFSRWSRLAPKVLILDEPTRGVDIGAKAEIYHIIRALADRGVAIVLISSELAELIGLSDRVTVMHEGRMAGTLEADGIGEEAIMQLAIGATA